MPDRDGLLTPGRSRYRIVKSFLARHLILYCVILVVGLLLRLLGGLVSYVGGVIVIGGEALEASSGWRWQLSCLIYQLHRPRCDTGFGVTGPRNVE